MARNKKSHRFKVLEGRQSEARLEALPDPVTNRWNSPEWLGKDGRDFHKKYWPMVRAMGLIRGADKPAWFNLCMRWQRIRQLESEIDIHGYLVKGRQGEIKRNPAASMLKAELEHFRRERAIFGLDPKSRDELGVDLSTEPPSVIARLID